MDAIQELNRSTDAINKQTDTLRQQQNALSRLISTSGKTGDARSDLEAKRLYQWESNRKSLQTSVSHFVDHRILLVTDSRARLNFCHKASITAWRNSTRGSENQAKT